MAVDFDEMTELSDSSPFKLVRGDTRPFEGFDQDVMALSIGMSLD